MNFTLLVVVLVLTHVYPVAGTGGSTSTGKGKDPGCVVVEEDGNNLTCMNGKTLYGSLTYSHDGSKRMSLDNISVSSKYRQKGVATALMNYFINNIAKKRNFEQIELLVVNGRGNTAAVKLYENSGFKWVAGSSDEMILKLE